MVDEVVQLKRKKEDIGYLKKYYESSALENTTTTRNKKSVSLVTPKSEKILYENKDAEKSLGKNKKDGKFIEDNGFISRICDDFKKAKVSKCQNQKVRERSSYKSFWATKTTATKTEEVEEKIGKATCTVQNNAIANKKLAFMKEAIGSDEIKLNKEPISKMTLMDTPRSCTTNKVLSTVDYHKEYMLKMPPNYHGSQMRMPTGEQLFWLGETRPASFGPATYQDFQEIRSRCLAEGKLFEDPEFPATNKSLYYKESLDKHIIWVRPGQIFEEPQFFVESYSRFDVQQGLLGDCWFLAAVANLTLHRKLFSQVVPEDQNFEKGEYAGVFHFRLWQYGRWVDVVIDDRLPLLNGKLAFLHSPERSEFWCALLEKAYAKLHGSYEALKGGNTSEAMVDFTGGITEIYYMNELPSDFFTILLKAHERNSLIGCNIEPDPFYPELKTPTGLVKGHSYSITMVKYVDIETPNRSDKIPMLRLRNPWGNAIEWNGPWSDMDQENWRYISKAEKKEIGLTSDDDGEFWISYQDFVHHFSKVEICNLNPDSLSPDECPEGCTKKWEMSVFEGQWIKGVTAGGCRNYLDTFWRNPQYTITLRDVDEEDEENKCTIIIALMQKNRRSQLHLGLEYLKIGIAVYRLPDHDQVPKPLDFNFFKTTIDDAWFEDFIDRRQVSYRYKLDPGTYVIIPSTFDPDEDGEFLLRVFSEKVNNMAENDEELGMGNIDERVKVPSPEPAEPVKEIFNRLAGADGEVNWQELKEILDYAMHEELGMRHKDKNGEDGPGASKNSLKQSCLEQLLRTLCSPCKGSSIDLQQLQQQNNQESLHISQPQPQGMSSELHGQGVSENVCRSMIAMLDKDNSGGLGFEEFKSLWIDLRNWRRTTNHWRISNVNCSYTRERRRDAQQVYHFRNDNVFHYLYSADSGIYFILEGMFSFFTNKDCISSDILFRRLEKN